MGNQESIFDLEVLRRREQIDRDRLANEPGDTEARIRLAWCLFMLALYHAGQENILTKLLTVSRRSKVASGNSLQAALDGGAQEILRDCLRQTCTVEQISADPRDCTDVAKLQMLAKSIGAQEMVTEAQEEAAHILAELTQGILYGLEGKS
jgi:hypothetical protein